MAPVFDINICDKDTTIRNVRVHNLIFCAFFHELLRHAV